MVQTQEKNKIQVFQENLKILKTTQDPSLKRLLCLQLSQSTYKYASLLEKKRLQQPVDDLRKFIIEDSLLKKKLASQIKKNASRRAHIFLLHKRLIPTLGILYLSRGKRNIFLTLCNSQNRIRASLSAGYLKFKGVKVKSKARKAMYNLKKLAHILVGLILKAKFKKLHLKFKTSFPKRVKRTFLRILGYKRKKFKICKLSRYRCKPHNGCRRPKMRRK